MIAKKINRLTGGKFSKLGKYLEAASEQGEKLDKLWIKNCATDFPEDLDIALKEIELTQDMNTRAKSDKTYHLVISFRDEKPPQEALEAIEDHFAKSLGLEDHQRIVATHKNTDNFHMHVAINKVHPETYRVMTPHYDFKNLQEACREMEKAYGLKIDNDKAPEQDQGKTHSVRDFEARSWQTSFFSYIKDNKDDLRKIRQTAKSWQELHKGLNDYGLTIKPHANGAVIEDIKTKARVKASELGRDFSFSKLKESFGDYQTPEKTMPEPTKIYEAKPLTTGKGQERLWNKFQKQETLSNDIPKIVFTYWRRFLTMEAQNDPEAMALIVAFSKFPRQSKQIAQSPQRKNTFGNKQTKKNREI